jgi:hypothetical protein
MQDPPAGGSRLVGGALFKRIEEEKGWVAWLRRPGGVFSGFQYPTPPERPSETFIEDACRQAVSAALGELTEGE